MKTKLWLFSLAIGLIFSACEKDDEFKGKPDGVVKGRVIATLESAPDNCEITAGETPLIAGQHHEVGTVRVDFENGDIIVTYKTKDGWFITETHLHVAADPEGIPTNRPGNPMIGLFEYGDDDIFETEVKYTISKSAIIPAPDNGCYYIAAHAVVVTEAAEGGYINLDAFAEILPETATVAIDHPADNEESYFNVHVSDAGILNGIWPGWCIQTGAVIDPGPPPVKYPTSVFSSYEDLSGYNEKYTSEVLMKINWILNQNFIELDNDGKPDYFTYGDLQIAMWTLLHGYDEFDDVVKEELKGTSPNPFATSVIGKWTREKVNEILSQVKNITEFFPECGGVIAVVFVHEAQDLIIEYPLPCYKDETAWGAGCLFVEKGNWAMYFKVCDND